MVPPHEWTKFEEDTLLALMVKGTHITKLDLLVEGSRKKKYMDIATALNNACHKGHYADDIPWKTVADKVEHWIATKRAGVSMMERHRVSHVTRTMKHVWTRGIKFDGTMLEWEGGRKDTVHLESKPSAGSSDWDNNPVATVEDGEQAGNGRGDTVQATTLTSEAVSNTDDVRDTQVATTSPMSNMEESRGAPATAAFQATASDPWSTTINNEVQAQTAEVLISTVDNSCGTSAPSQARAVDLWGTSAAAVSETTTSDPWGTTTNDEAQAPTDGFSASVEPSTAIRSSPDLWTREESPDSFDYDLGVAAPNSAAVNIKAVDLVTMRESTASKASTATTNRSGDLRGSMSTTASSVWGEDSGSIQPIALSSNNNAPVFTDQWAADRVRQAGPLASTDPWRNWDEPVSPRAITQQADIATSVANMYSAQLDNPLGLPSAITTGNMGGMANLSENQNQPGTSVSSQPFSQVLEYTTVPYGMNPERLRMLNKTYSELDVGNTEDTVMESIENDGAQSGFTIGGSNTAPLSFNQFSGDNAKVTAKKDVRDLEGDDAMNLGE